MVTCGVDPCRERFSVSFVENMVEFDYQEYENSPQGFEQFVERLKPLNSSASVCIEGYGDFGKQLAMHLKGKNIRVYEINPKMSKRLKESITEHKTDHIDAFSCSLFPYIRNDLKELTLDMGIEALRNLCRLHLKISKQVVRLKNQLHAALNQSFGPVYKRFFSDLSATSMQFYVHYASYEEIDEASVSDIHTVLKKGGSCMYKGNYGAKRVAHIKEIVSHIHYHPLRAFAEMQSEVIKSYAQMLLIAIEQEKKAKKSIETYVKRMFPHYKRYFTDIKGVTALQFARLVSEIKDINNFRNDACLASYSGQSPRLHQSAGSKKTKPKRDYNRYLAYVIHMICCSNITKGRRFHAEYTRMKGKYSRKLRAMKNIKRKMVRILYFKLKAYMSDLKQKEPTQEAIINVT